MVPGQDRAYVPAGLQIPADGLTGTTSTSTATGRPRRARRRRGQCRGITLTFVVTFSDDIYDYEAYISGLNPPAPGQTPQTAEDEDLAVYSYGQYCYVSGLTWEDSDGVRNLERREIRQRRFDLPGRHRV
jgi:hypothetical protein